MLPSIRLPGPTILPASLIAHRVPFPPSCSHAMYMLEINHRPRIPPQSLQDLQQRRWLRPITFVANGHEQRRRKLQFQCFPKRSDCTGGRDSARCGCGCSTGVVLSQSRGIRVRKKIRVRSGTSPTRWMCDLVIQRVVGGIGAMGMGHLYTENHNLGYNQRVKSIPGKPE